MDVSVVDLNIARQRIKAAVCAFGGTMRKVIYSVEAGAQGSRTKSSKKFYLENLPKRYKESENHLSWECEENPPLRDGDDSSLSGNLGESSKSPANVTALKASDDSKHELPQSDPVVTSEEEQQPNSDSFSSPSRELMQIRYRCRMCGQLKYNHTCPMLRSVQRSIGVMVYPALNAFIASEPGLLAPPLSEMNNFTGSFDTSSFPEKTPSRFTMDDQTKRMEGDDKTPSHYVTPDAIMKGNINSTEFAGHFNNSQRVVKQQQQQKGRQATTSYTYDLNNNSYENNHLISSEMDLKPEQFRIAHLESSQDSYIYPAVPLPYSQRKQLSDFLLTISSSCTQLRDECALVLQQGRERGMWDLAVAELITQVIMLYYCHACDVRLDGLSNYLRSMGISC